MKPTGVSYLSCIESFSETMAQPIDAHKSSPGSKGSRTQTSPHSQHFKGEASSQSSNSSPILRKNHDHDNHGNHHIKKSVFMRMKEKARKLKKSISGRKRRDENESCSPYATPPGSAGPLDDDKDRPEFFGSPLYEPTVEPEFDKHAAKEHSRETNKNTSDVDRGSTDSTDSKLAGLTISGDRDANKTEPKVNTTSSPQPQDKGTEEPSQSTSKASNSELDGSNSNVKMGDSSSIEASNVKTGSLADSPNPSHSVEPNLANASNINTCSTSTSASGQNQNMGSSSTGCSNLKPNSGSNHSDSNPTDSSSSPNVHFDTSANATQATTSASSHEVQASNLDSPTHS
ncbi:hypothetical protein L6452_42764 [Arctium lappa]|uniref:Uncharacterized protein n=1 Tax=Arctium lappa TaxID=4217 RepID=A0ACB8XKX5_ARCLA|nr:hypothetical protein L6452_42764 [Arctium lappa]